MREKVASCTLFKNPVKYLAQYLIFFKLTFDAMQIK